MTIKDITTDNVEKISDGNPTELYEFNYDTEQYHRTGIESVCDKFRLKNTGEIIQYDYQDKRVYDRNFHDLDDSIGERLVELGLAHPGGVEGDDNLAQLIAATDCKADGVPENVDIECDDNDDAGDAE